MQKVVIVSSDDHILYQPSILNLYDFLKTDFEVTIISFEPAYLGNKKDSSRNIVYILMPDWRQKIYRLIDLSFNAIFKRIDKYLFRFSFRMQCVRLLKCRLLIRQLNGIKATHVIAVDILPLYAVQQVYPQSHFFSLEILQNDSLLKKIDLSKILSVIIQNKDRYDYLFGKTKFKTFYIQNAPFCENISINRGERKGLVWGGSIIENFGVFKCLDFVNAYPENRLMLKGAANIQTRNRLGRRYRDLLASQQVIMDERYLPAKEFVDFLSNFRIGFCFYGWELIKNNFNYKTAPSGKLFMYLAAGVPVVACNIPAFKFVEDFNAGILIDDYEPATIYKAVKTIENEYEKFRENSYTASLHFCFEKEAEKFREYLLSENFIKEN